MTWHVITVAKSELGLALGAIRLGGGTITSTSPSAEDVAITYVVGDERATLVPPYAAVG
ncbi:hypothetical protein GCM10009798_03680 [Nocardioides panacihumi]|uniref:Uncharacterized protein n=1 Tax=Nocardioides panacihumi TaxID=400774 RepID=A0ABP5BL23_9ACTN